MDWAVCTSCACRSRPALFVSGVAVPELVPRAREAAGSHWGERGCSLLPLSPQ